MSGVRGAAFPVVPREPAAYAKWAKIVFTPYDNPDNIKRFPVPAHYIRIEVKTPETAVYYLDDKIKDCDAQSSVISALQIGGCPTGRVDLVLPGGYGEIAGASLGLAAFVAAQSSLRVLDLNAEMPKMAFTGFAKIENLSLYKSCKVESVDRIANKLAAAKLNKVFLFFPLKCWTTELEDEFGPFVSVTKVGQGQVTGFEIGAVADTLSDVLTLLAFLGGVRPARKQEVQKRKRDPSAHIRRKVFYNELKHFSKLGAS